jgi:heme b synthase
MTEAPHAGPGEKHLPHLIAWEVTRSCMLACKHCRAAAKPVPYSDELSTEECRKLLDNIASFSRPIIILTGGEPMLRADIYEIAAYACRLGLPVVMAPCGMLINDVTAAKIVESGVRRISISLDGVTAEAHDAFRGVKGAFEGAMRGIEAAKRAGLDFQVNTTITKDNVGQLPDMVELARRLGASVFNPFLLVPTGRGKELADQELSPGQYEETLVWLAERQVKGDIPIRVTCAPHYQRILRQRGAPAGPRPVKGCMGGQSFAFISHRGKVQICGFLDLECGDVRKEGFDFRKIWETSEMFLRLRDIDRYEGRCGRCEFRKVCGGCRARAYAMTGDYLAEEPFCAYSPKTAPPGERDASGDRAELDEVDGKLISVIQTEFPVVRRPFDELSAKLAVPAAELIRRVERLKKRGVIRRLGAIFDSGRLGYVSTLVAAEVPAGQLDESARVVSALPGVTHNYRRDHRYDLWFTLSAPSQGEIDETLARLRQRAPWATFHSLPALQVYKILVDFRLDGGDSVGPAAPASRRDPARLDDTQKRLVRVLQEDLPAEARPFDAVAAEAGLDAEKVLTQIGEWLAGGVIRRFGAVVRHQRLGFAANGMAVFAVEAERIDDVGRRLAELPEVSHCYRRPKLPGFPYELYAMIHGHAREEVLKIAADIARAARLSDYAVLFSTKEYKKVSMRYFVEDTPATRSQAGGAQ